MEDTEKMPQENKELYCKLFIIAKCCVTNCLVKYKHLTKYHLKKLTSHSHKSQIDIFSLEKKQTNKQKSSRSYLYICIFQNIKHREISLLK